VTGSIFLVTAPSGTGKTTLLKRLFDEDAGLRFSVSYTTRPARPGEVNGEDYFFVSPAEFQRLEAQGAMVESVEQFGYWYGTSKEWIAARVAEGHDLVFDVDSRGGRAIKVHFPQAILIFVLPPTLEELERRLKGRGDLEPEELKQRLEQGRSELGQVSFYDFLVINDDLAQASHQLKAIVAASRLRVSRLWPHLASRYPV
jgi:guanylate kinase